jgi:hypothetical protein
MAPRTREGALIKDHPTGRLISVPVGPSADPVVVRQLKNRSDRSQGVVLVIDHLYKLSQYSA